jgi:hypothetical protein
LSLAERMRSEARKLLYKAPCDGLVSRLTTAKRADGASRRRPWGEARI